MAALGATMERTRLAYGQDAAGRGWDRQWRLVAFAVPEQKRVARDAFRDQLRVLGGAAIPRCYRPCFHYRCGVSGPSRRTPGRKLHGESRVSLSSRSRAACPLH